MGDPRSPVSSQYCSKPEEVQLVLFSDRRYSCRPHVCRGRLSALYYYEGNILLCCKRVVILCFKFNGSKNNERLHVSDWRCGWNNTRTREPWDEIIESGKYYRRAGTTMTIQYSAAKTIIDVKPTTGASYSAIK